MNGVILAVTSAIVGVLTTAVGTVLAAAGSTEIAPWAQVTGTATAVAGLAYVAKLLAQGRLVAEPVDLLIHEAAKREQKLVELVEAGKEREDAFRAWLVGRGIQ